MTSPPYPPSWRECTIASCRPAATRAVEDSSTGVPGSLRISRNGSGRLSRSTSRPTISGTTTPARATRWHAQASTARSCWELAFRDEATHAGEQHEVLVAHRPGQPFDPADPAADETRTHRSDVPRSDAGHDDILVPSACAS